MAIFIEKVFLGCLLICSGALLAEELNIRDFGATGNGQGNNVSAFNQAFKQLAKSTKGSVLKIPAGQYRVDGSLVAVGLKDVTVRGEAGTEICFADIKKNCIEINHCANTSFENISFRHLQNSCAQGKVTAHPDRRKLIVESNDKSFASLTQPNMRIMLQLYSPAGMQDHRFHRSIVRSITPVPEKPGSYEVSYDMPHDSDDVMGQIAAVFLRGGRPVVIVLNSSDCRFENIRIHNGGDLAFGLRYCDGMVFRNCRIARDKDSGLFVTTGADGIHSKHSRRGPLIENCDFSGMSDDNVNLSTTMQNVASASDATLILTGDNRDYRPGDRVIIFDIEKNQVIERASIIAAAPCKWQKFDAVKVTFDHKLPILKTLDLLKKEKPYNLLFGHKDELPAMIYNLETTHPGTIIRNNRFGNNRARGILLRTPDTIIENNTFYNLARPAILIAFEGMWMECGKIENVTIRNNSFDSVSRSPIMFSYISSATKRETTNVISQKLLISGNTFTNCGAPSIESNSCNGEFGNMILVENAMDVTIENNRFGRIAGAPKLPSIITNFSTNVKILNNQEQ